MRECVLAPDRCAERSLDGRMLLPVTCQEPVLPENPLTLECRQQSHTSGGSTTSRDLRMCPRRDHAPREKSATWHLDLQSQPSHHHSGMASGKYLYYSGLLEAFCVACSYKRSTCEMHPSQQPLAFWFSARCGGSCVLFILFHVRDHIAYLEEDPKPTWQG